MRILLVITALEVGGAELQVLELTRFLISRSHTVKVVSLRNKRRLLEEFTEAGAEVFCLHMENACLLLNAMLRFRKIVRNYSPHVVHSHMVHANLFCRIARIFMRFEKLFCTAHSNNEGGLMRKLGYRFTDSLADYTTNVSEAAVNTYLQERIAPLNKIGCIPNGINIDKFKPNRHAREILRKEFDLQNNFVFINVARLEPEKDHVTLLRAFATTLDRMKGSRLIIVGSGGEEATLTEYSATLNISDKVFFTGERTDIAEILNAGDCFVLSSKWEGFGLVIAEAMAVGLPVISTDSGGPKEILSGSGCLVPVRDFRRMADAMISVQQMPRNQRDIGVERGREIIVSRYSIEIVGEKWLELYKSER